MRQAIPAGVSLEQLHKPSIRPSPESASIFVPADSSVEAPSSMPAAPATAPAPAVLVLPTPIPAPAKTTSPAMTASPATTTNLAPPSLESFRLDTQWEDVMEVDGEPAVTTASKTQCLELATASSSAGAA
ncbi:hypothetical protein ZWY2020_020327 [Hordeum vulgare]|nr:hypothetical protein ZWY2020_020327 [Hordeum vulgare]